MQSIRQYRRFGKHVQEQYERDVERLKEESNRRREGVAEKEEERQGKRSVAGGVGEKGDYGVEKDLIDGNGTSRREETDLLAVDVEKSASNNITHEGAPPPLVSPPPISPSSTSSTSSSSISTLATTIHQPSPGTALGTTLTGIQPRSRTTKEGEKGSPVFIVGYHSPTDILNPHNWSLPTRILATMNIAAIGWIVGLASSIDSGALMQASREFGVSEVAESLATGLFLVGFGFGALFAGPVSETVGRNPVYIGTLAMYMVFIMAAGLAPNFGAQCVFRFLAGCFAATPLTCAGGSISDLWNPMERVYAFPVFANAAFMGPVFGPVVGGFIGESSRVSWRWVEWVTLIISGGVLFLVVFFQPETYAPTLLKWKAAHLRKITGDERYRAEIEVRQQGFGERLLHALYRPFLLTFREPIIMLIALYLTVIYIILFTFLNGYTFIFTETYGFTQGITGLAFLGIAIGLCCASCLVPGLYIYARRELARIKSQGGDRLPPEFRLWFAMLGAPAIPISLFWMGWTARPTISYWSPLVASVVFGYGILCVFISSYQYIIDSYEIYSASALASVTLIRYAAAVSQCSEDCFARMVLLIC